MASVATCDAAELLIELGVGMVGLTWNHRNAAADGCSEPPHSGMSKFGRELTERLVAQRVIMDVAHANARTFDDVLEVAGAGGGYVACSHTDCAAIDPTPRNLTDTKMRSLRSVDLVVGIAAVPLVLRSDDRSVDRMAEHICHAIDVMGIDHVGIGPEREHASATGSGYPSGSAGDRSRGERSEKILARSEVGPRLDGAGFRTGIHPHHRRFRGLVRRPTGIAIANETAHAVTEGSSDWFVFRA